MKTCLACKNFAMSGECVTYKRIPPPGFAAKCKKFIQTEEQPENIRQCEKCEQYDEGYCLRLDHPEWDYNFVKIWEGIVCPKE